MSRLVRRAAEERGELAGDLGGCLAAVAQRPQLDRHALRRSAAARSIRGLAGALGRLVVGERLRGVDVAEALVQRRELLPARGPDAEALRDHADDRARLHLADPGKREQALLEIGAVARARPHGGGVAAVLARDRGAELLRAPGHVGREAVQRRLLAEDLLELAADPSLRSSLASSPPSRCASTSGEENAFCTVTC